MKRYLILFLSILLLLPLSCKKPREEDRQVSPYSIKETLDSIPLIIATEKQIEVLNLKTLKPFRAYPINLTDFIKTVLLENKVFLICEKDIYLIDLEEEKVTKVHLPVKVKGVSTSKDNIILYGQSSVFGFDKGGRLTKLADFQKTLREIHTLPDFSSIIAVFHKDEVYELSKFSLLSKKLEQGIELRDFLKLDISPFGKRMYVLTKNNLLFLETKDLEIISEIPFKAECVDFVITASENKIFIFTKNPAKIISIKRTILKVVSEIDLIETPVQKWITGDGGTIFFVSQDTLYRFDTGSNEVVIMEVREKKTDILLTTEKGLRVITGKKGDFSLEVIDGNTLLPIKEIPLNSKLLDILCGREPYKQRLTEAVPVESTRVDATMPIPQQHKDKYYTLQVSSSSIREGAVKLYKKIKMLSLPVYIDSSELKGEQRIFKVKIGAFKSREDTDDFKRGIKGTYDLSSWVLEDVIEPYILKEAGVDISGDKNREILLLDNNRILLFTNYGGIQRSVLNKSIEGIHFNGKPKILKEGKETLFGLPFNEDSVLVIKWIGDRYEIIKRKIPKG